MVEEKLALYSKIILSIRGFNNNSEVLESLFTLVSAKGKEQHKNDTFLIHLMPL